MLKNVTLLPTTQNGKRTWLLLGPGNEPVEPFSVFVKSISRANSRNTVEAYSRNLAQFFDYLYEASAALQSSGSGALTQGMLLDVIEAYDEFLVYGQNSGNEIAQLVAQTLPSPFNSRQTSATKHAPVRRFLELSDKIHGQIKELVGNGLLVRHESSDQLIDTGKVRVAPSGPQRKALLANSMLAGVIAGGSKLIPNAILQTVQPQTSFDESRAFPFDQIEDFIRELPSHRDKAFYSLLAASGCRTHEGLQILFDDIDFEKRDLCLVDPKTRPRCDSYLYLTPLEREKLAWKGRNTSRTLMIEPFASLFFEELAAYLKTEYIPHGFHRFVFQYRHRKLRGRPFFLSDSETRSELFHKTVLASGIEQNVHGPHSLRHAYGTYLLNYFPRINGSYGLGIGVVQQMMGHTDLRSTQQYARHDQDLIRAELEFANNMVFGRGSPKSLIQMKLNALNSQVLQLESQLKKEQLEGRVVN